MVTTNISLVFEERPHQYNARKQTLAGEVESLKIALVLIIIGVYSLNLPGKEQGASRENAK
jgi:hypothetical protein